MSSCPDAACRSVDSELFRPPRTAWKAKPPRLSGSPGRQRQRRDLVAIGLCSAAPRPRKRHLRLSCSFGQCKKRPQLVARTRASDPQAGLLMLCCGPRRGKDTRIVQLLGHQRLWPVLLRNGLRRASDNLGALPSCVASPLDGATTAALTPSVESKVWLRMRP
jgi:hypothetical protein